MWHDDNWQPYAEYDAPSVATDSWRRYRQQGLPFSAASTVPPIAMSGIQHSSRLLYHRQLLPYSRLLPQSHLLMRSSHVYGITAASSRELSWRTANDGWGIPQSRVRNLVWHNVPTHSNADIPKSMIEITTPHAGGDLRARPIPTKRNATDSLDDLFSNIDHDRLSKQPALYSDFSEPAKPKKLILTHESSAICITILWDLPEFQSLHKYKQKIEVRDDLTIVEEDCLALHITSFRFKTTPGCFYVVNLKVVDNKDVVVASGTLECKAMFSLGEIRRLMGRAMDFTGNAMQTFSFLYRCKPKIYWDDIYFRTNGIVERYIKDNNGQAASPINGSISGLFFSARTLADGMIPPSSPFGDIRMIVPSVTLLDPNRVSLFFCDFYCNRIVHYITVVVCEKGSQTEEFCKEKLVELDIENNRFLRIISTNNPNMPYAFYVNKSVWVEIYYTENIPMHWGQFDHIIPTGAGTSKIGGLPHNKSCLTCNLYPVGPAPGVNVEPVEDLVATYESQAKTTALFPRNSTRYTALGCIQAELLAPSSKLSAEITKEEYLDVAEVLVYCVDYTVFQQSYQALKKYNTIKTNENSSFIKKNVEILVITLSDDEENTELCFNKKKQNSNNCDKSVLLSKEQESMDKSFESLNSTLVLIDEENEKENLDETLNLTNETSNSSALSESNKKNEDDVFITAENLTLPKSLHLMKWLNKIGNNVSKTPIVLNLVSKLKALVKEIDHNFTNFNSEIDSCLSTESLLVNKKIDMNTSIMTCSSISGVSSENSALNLSNN